MLFLVDLQLARMFLPSKKVHIAGVTAPSTASLLSSFAERGTCYWRLLRFTSAGLASSAVTNYKSMGRGVIFKVLYRFVSYSVAVSESALLKILANLQKEAEKVIFSSRRLSSNFSNR